MNAVNDEDIYDKSVCCRIMYWYRYSHWQNIKPGRTVTKREILEVIPQLALVMDSKSIYSVLSSLIPEIRATWLFCFPGLFKPYEFALGQICVSAMSLKHTEFLLH